MRREDNKNELVITFGEDAPMKVLHWCVRHEERVSGHSKVCVIKILWSKTKPFKDDEIRKVRSSGMKGYIDYLIPEGKTFHRGEVIARTVSKSEISKGKTEEELLQEWSNSLNENPRPEWGSYEAPKGKDTPFFVVTILLLVAITIYAFKQHSFFTAVLIVLGYLFVIGIILPIVEGLIKSKDENRWKSQLERKQSELEKALETIGITRSNTHRKRNKVNARRDDNKYILSRLKHVESVMLLRPKGQEEFDEIKSDVLTRLKEYDELFDYGVVFKERLPV